MKKISCIVLNALLIGALLFAPSSSMAASKDSGNCGERITYQTCDKYDNSQSCSNSHRDNGTSCYQSSCTNNRCEDSHTQQNNGCSSCTMEEQSSPCNKTMNYWGLLLQLLGYEDSIYYDFSAINTQSQETEVELSSFAEEVLILVNEARAEEGLDPLTADSTLTEAAEIRATEISDVFSHTRPDGSSCFTALEETNAVYQKAGENIAIGQTTPVQVVEEWLASPGHRANIMNSDFSRIGIAATPSSSEIYGGYAWVQLFAD